MLHNSFLLSYIHANKITAVYIYCIYNEMLVIKLSGFRCIYSVHIHFNGLFYHFSVLASVKEEKKAGSWC